MQKTCCIIGVEYWLGLFERSYLEIHRIWETKRTVLFLIERFFLYGVLGDLF